MVPSLQALLLALTLSASGEGLSGSAPPRSPAQTHRLGPVDPDGQLQGVAAQSPGQGHTRVGFHTDSPVMAQAELSLPAAAGVRHGLDTTDLEHARGLTILPAQTAGSAHRAGSLEPRKDAGLQPITGDLADPRTSVEVELIEGRRIYDAARDRRRW
jgi:hypothetical protein